MSEQRTDHAAEARRLLNDYPGAIGNRPFDAAQVHAMLALVDELRKRNEQVDVCAHGVPGVCMTCLTQAIYSGLSSMRMQ